MNNTIASSQNTEKNPKLKKYLDENYSAGFSSDIDSFQIDKGLNEETIKKISQLKNEPEYMLEWRLKAYYQWLKMSEPNWAVFPTPKIDFNDIIYYSSPKSAKDKPKSLDEVDPELLKIYDRLGVPLHEREKLAGVERPQSNIAVDAVFDSVSVVTVMKDKLEEAGVIFCSISEAIREYPDLIKKYLGSVVPPTDNYFATLNSAVFSDGSFCYIPKGVKSPMELSTYFRINAIGTGQFERTLIIADEGSYVSYLEGCTAPSRDESQLHAAVVELVALDNAEIKYSTVQNWYPGDKEGKGGIYNFVTKRGKCKNNAKISWTQVETGSSITWKYPSVVLEGDYSKGEFYSVALTKNKQLADTGTKMIHIGKGSSSHIISKGISSGSSTNTYRGLVKIMPSAQKAKNFTQCDSLMLSDTSNAQTIPYIETKNNTAKVEHEATVSKLSDEQLNYCLQRGLDSERATSLLVNGFCKEVFAELPMEFATEVQALIEISLEGTVG